MNHNPWEDFVKLVNGAFRNRDFGLSPIEFIQMNYVKEVPLLTNKTDFNDRYVVLSEFISLAEGFISTYFSEYRILFDSDQEFANFFLNENGFDEAKLVDIVSKRFRSFISNLGDGQGLKGSYNSPLGKEMLIYCRLGYYKESEFFEAEYLPSVSRMIEKLLADFISQNRPLEKAKNRHNGSCRNFMISYVYDK